MQTFIDVLNESFEFDWKVGTEPPVIDKKLWKDRKIPSNLLYEKFIGIKTKVNGVEEYNINPKIKNDFLKKVVFISEELGAKPDWMMAIFNHESAGQFSPKTKGSSSTGATGLIQITNPTAKGSFGISSSELPTDPIRHLDYVFAYFYRFTKNKKITNPIDLYIIVFTPGYYNEPMDFKYPAKYIRQNPANFGYFKKNDKRYGTKLDLYQKLLTGKTAFAVFYKRGDYELDLENGIVRKDIPQEDVAINLDEPETSVKEEPKQVSPVARKKEEPKIIFNSSSLKDIKDISTLNMSNFKG